MPIGGFLLIKIEEMITPKNGSRDFLVARIFVYKNDQNLKIIYNKINLSITIVKQKFKKVSWNFLFYLLQTFEGRKIKK